MEARAAGLIEGVCRACATKTGSLAEAQAQGLPLLDDMSGHPSLGRYLEAGFTLLNFLIFPGPTPAATENTENFSARSSHSFLRALPGFGLSQGQFGL
ncbi:MAG: hypothetical protein WBV23_00110 [Desulfobaccales bacterium]